MGDAEGYRPVGELDRLKARDPIPRMKALLLAERVLDESAASKIEREAQKVVDDAVTFARQSPYPQPLEALEKLYA
jgi:pyruvate dehydrogenase E1 component alpha subunit